MGRLIGHGAFGHVHRAVHTLSGTAVAIKVIPVPSRGTAESERAFEENVKRELETMRHLSHPHIISVIEAFAPLERTAMPAGKSQHPPRAWHIVLELCSGCDLQQLVDRHGALEIDDVRVIAAQLCSAIQHMHEHGGLRTSTNHPALIIARPPPSPRSYRCPTPPRERGSVPCHTCRLTCTTANLPRAPFSDPPRHKAGERYGSRRRADGQQHGCQNPRLWPGVRPR